MRVKICGIMSTDDAAMCESLGADALGFVHFPGRRRSLSLEAIERIVSALGPMISKVLVCSPENADHAIDMADRTRVDTVQLYSLVPEDIRKIRARGIKVIRAISLNQKDASKFVEVCDAILFDGTDPGSGKSYDYSKIPVGMCKRCIIAGGLSIGNLQAAKSLKPYALDVSTGVENEFGRKDPTLVSEFIRRCKA